MAARAGRARRWWRFPLYGLGGLLGLALLLSALLQTGLARERIRLGVNQALAPLFRGKIQIDRLDGLGLWGVSGVDARIFDPSGQQVIRAQGLEARAALPQLGWQLLFGGSSPRLTIDHVRIDYADVTLREHEELGVTLATTFELAEVDEPPPADEAEGALELHIADIELARVWAHGRVTGSPPLDADLLELRAALRQGATGFALDLRGTQLVTRALPGGAEPRGKVWGSIDVPDEPERPLRLEGFLDGQAAGSPLWLEATWVGDELYAKVGLPRLPASYVNGQVSGLALQGELNVLVEAEGTLPELEVQADVRGQAAHVAVNGHAFLADGLEASLALAASGVDLAGLVPDAPPSDLSLQLDAFLLEAEHGGLELAHRVQVGSGRLADVATPPVGVRGQLLLEEAGGLKASGDWQVAETGANLSGRYRGRYAQGSDDFVWVSVAGEIVDPPRAAALGIATAGRIEGEAELWLESELVKARLDLSLKRLDYGARDPNAFAIQARVVELRAQLAGSLDDPRAHAATTAELLSGRVHADVSYSTRSQQASLFVADVDLHRLATLLGTPLPFEQGNLNADFAAHHEGTSQQPIELDGKLRADFGKVGDLQLTATSLKLPSSLEGPGRLGGVSGQLVAHGRLDLAHANRLSKMLGFPLERSTGIVRFELSGKRAEGGAPELGLLLDTNALRIVERREARSSISSTAEAVENAPFAFEGIDAHASLRFLPETGEAVGTVITRDRGGTLALVEAEATLGRDWLSRLSEPQALLETPLRAHLEVPERRLQGLPPLMRPPGLRGRIALDAELAGSLLEPRVRGWVNLQRLRTQRGNETVDVRTTFRYARANGEVYAHAAGGRGEDLGRLNASWQGDVLKALASPTPAVPLVGSADVELFGLPLEVLPILAEQQLKGRLTGRAKLRDWGKAATLDARIEGRDLKVGTHALPSVLVAAQCSADKLVAELGITTGKGAARAKLEADARWGARPLPELERRGVAKLSAQRFELATFSPLLGAYLSELSGILDADAQVTVDGDDTRVSGSAKLEQGVIQVPAIGQRFSDISAQMAVGENKFKLRQLTARADTGKLTASGSAALDGFALRSAELRASIGKKEALPLTIEGAAVGDAWGNLKVTYLSPPTGERRLDVDVPEFHLITPDAGGASLQELDNADEIRIGTRRADGTFVVLPVQPLEPTTEEPGGGERPAQPLRIRITLGNNVTVARGATAQVQLTGQLVVLSDPETSVTGRIELRGGKLDVQGKTFEIERGVITFNGKEPSNPTVTATARWDAPEHTVYAEYVGDVETGRIKLRAEPPLTQDQIASLLLFGDPDGSRGGSDPNTAALAVSVAGDTAAKGLNKALSDFTSLDVRARVDTTTGSARPELQLQVSPRVAAKVTRAIGEPAVGESPDRTFLTLELRLRRGWALSALLGDHGASALDLIWRHRY